MLMSQIGLDQGDPFAFAHHLIANEFEEKEGRKTHILIQESMGDAVMPNHMTETFARTMGLPLIEPFQFETQGLSTASAPTSGTPASGLTQFTVSEVGFQAHLAMSYTEVEAQIMSYFTSFVDEDPSNDGDISFPMNAQ